MNRMPSEQVRVDQRRYEFYHKLTAQGMENKQAWKVAREMMIEENEARKAKQGEPLLRMADEAAFEGKSSDKIEAIEWVAENVAIKDVKPEQAPSKLAWSMLQWAQRSAVNQSEFWKSMFSRIVPSRSELDMLAKQKLEPDELMDLIDQVRSMSGA